MALIVLGTNTLVVVPIATNGYIAGEAPSGLVSDQGTPCQAILDLFIRSTNLWIRREVSNDDGTYRFGGLPLDVQYNVVGRDALDDQNDVIVSRVLAYAPPAVTNASLSFTVGVAATTQMTSQHGVGPMTWSISATPAGLSLSSVGLWSGTPTTPGSTAATATVTDSYGEAGTKAFSITVV